MNVDTVRSDIPTSSTVTDVLIWDVEQSGENPFTVTYEVDQQIKEGDQTRDVSEIYTVTVLVDIDGDMVIIQNPTLAPAMEKSDYKPKAREENNRVEADTTADATAFLETFFELYPAATDKELAYYVEGNVLEPRGGDYLYSELVNPVFVADGDNVKVRIYMYFLYAVPYFCNKAVKTPFYTERNSRKGVKDFMRFFKRLFISLFVIIMISVLVGGFCIFYAFKIEPYRLKINEYTLNDSVENSTEIKIVQFSDLHIKEDFTCKNLEKVVCKINGQNPDIVVFTGDLYDNYATYHDDENIVEQLSNIKATYGKIAIWGNRDYGGGAVRQYESIMEQSGFTLLKNENWYITIENGKKILFTGLDDSMLGNPYMPDSTKIYDSDYDILLTHEPDSIEDYSDYEYNIVLSGHSHGGQINIPFLPQINETALSVTSLATEYGGGMYDLQFEGISKLYVNTGIGTTHISVRFGVVPEVTVFYIYL